MSDPIYRQRRLSQFPVKIHPAFLETVVEGGYRSEMKGPELVKLDFELVTDDPLHTISDDAPAISGALGYFDCVLDGGMLTATPVRQAFSDPDEAERSLRPYLLNWVSYAHLVRGILMRFSFTSTGFATKPRDPMLAHGRPSSSGRTRWGP